MSLLDKKKTLTDHYFTERISDRGTYTLAYTVNNGEILRVEIEIARSQEKRRFHAVGIVEYCQSAKQEFLG